MISITYFSFAALLFVLNYFYIWNKYSRITRIWIVSLPTWLICLLAKWASLEHENDTNNSLNYSSSFFFFFFFPFSLFLVFIRVPCWLPVTSGDDAVRESTQQSYYVQKSTTRWECCVLMLVYWWTTTQTAVTDFYTRPSTPPPPPPSSNSVKGSLWEGFELPRGTLTSYPDQLGVWNKLM